MANSYHHIDTVGYFYIENKETSTHNSWRNSKKKNKIIDSFFLNVRFFCEKSNDTYLDKLYCIHKIKNYFKRFNNLFINLNNSQYYYIKSIIDKIVNLNYISKEDKIFLSKIELFK